MEKRLLGFDSNGVREDFVFDPVTQSCGVARTFEANEWGALHENQRLQNDGWDGYSGDKDKAFKKVASIPLQVVEIWESIYGVNPLEQGNEKLLTRLLNDPDWNWVRCSRGRVKIKEA